MEGMAMQGVLADLHGVFFITAGACLPNGDLTFRFNRKGSAMTQIGCRSCRLRFTEAGAAYLINCPGCGRPPQPIARAEDVIGFRLFVVEDAPPALPEALAVSMPIPDPGAGRS
jgi:hypothetical protein